MMFDKAIPQKYKYDCGVAAIYSLLSYNDNDIDIDIAYKDLEFQLKITSLLGTFPKNIIHFLESNNISFQMELCDFKKCTVDVLVGRKQRFQNFYLFINR